MGDEERWVYMQHRSAAGFKPLMLGISGMRLEYQIIKMSQKLILDLVNS